MRPRYEPRPNHARLWRNRKKVESWQSDFLGKVTLQDAVTYHVGVTRRTTFAGEEYLAIYLRPDLTLPVGHTYERVRTKIHV